MASRARRVHVIESDFRDHSAIEGGGVALARPPSMPGNVIVGRGVEPYSCVLALKSTPKGATIPLTASARVMGPLEAIKSFLRGRKFFILNRCGDWVCVELSP